MWVKLRSYYWWTNLSSTNRSNARDEHIADYYVTPISDIELFLKSFQKVVPLNWNNSITDSIEYMHAVWHKSNLKPDYTKLVLI